METKRTHLHDIFQDMYNNIDHELIRANYEDAVKKFVAVLKCKYDGRLYKITLELE